MSAGHEWQTRHTAQQKRHGQNRQINSSGLTGLTIGSWHLPLVVDQLLKVQVAKCRRCIDPGAVVSAAVCVAAAQAVGTDQRNSLTAGHSRTGTVQLETC